MEEINMMNKNEMVEKLLEAKRQYYIEGTSFLSDSQFDALEEELRKVDPNNKYFSIVGVNIKGSDNIKHNHPLLSCAKGKKSEDAIKWLERINYSGDLVGMAKLDGLTGCVTYIDGKFSHMVTRGDGEIGQDVSHLQSYLNIPKEIPRGGIVDVVGEIILPKNTKLKTNGKPLRNIASGLVNRKELSDDLKNLHFVAYNLLGQNNLVKFIGRLDRLNLFNFETVFNIVIEKDFIPFFYKNYEEKLREDFLYETDGIVLQVNDLSQLERINSLYVVDHHNHYNFALKGKSLKKETILRNIEWDVSKYGYCIPVASFDEITIMDRKISRASLSNYETVERMKFEIGDKIIVALNNDVIPYVVKNESKNIYQ
jgi:DNA ligase (NAD+)